MGEGTSKIQGTRHKVQVRSKAQVGKARKDSSREDSKQSQFLPRGRSRNFFFEVKRRQKLNSLSPLDPCLAYGS